MSSGHVAEADCERCRAGLVAQPVNTLSSLTISTAGLTLLVRVRGRPASTAERALGVTGVAAGLGSVAYHGPGTRLGQFAHDATLIALLGALIAADVERASRWSVPRPAYGVLGLVAAGAARSRWSLGVQVGFGVVAVAAEVARVRAERATGEPPWREIAETAVAVSGAAAHVLGRTGGPLCRPDSRRQAHAAWHTATALVLVLRD